MKKLVIKKQDVSKPIIFILFIILIVFGKALFEMEAQKEIKTSTIFDEYNYSFMPIQQTFLPADLPQYQKSAEQHTGFKVETEIKPTSNNSLAQLKAYLVEETEPKLKLKDVESILFPDEAEQNNRITNDLALQAMKTEASRITDSIVNSYAFQTKIFEFLTVEQEKPLQLEDWMINSKCWCPEFEEPMSIALFK